MKSNKNVRLRDIAIELLAKYHMAQSRYLSVMGGTDEDSMALLDETKEYEMRINSASLE